MSHVRYNQGFTLIETAIYIGLLGIIMTSGVLATYQILGHRDAIHNNVILQEETTFILRKLDWALTGAISVSTPASNRLVIIKNINNVNTQLTFHISDKKLTLARNAEAPIVLNSSSIQFLENSLFVKTTGDGNTPDGITAQFTLEATGSGRNASKSFSMTKYLRK